MPIVRTYACEDCNFLTEVTLTMDQVDAPPPDCPMCAMRPMQQEFKPVAIGGSNRARATAIAEEIAANDYHVSDMDTGAKEGDYKRKVRYKDQSSTVPASQWGIAQEALQGAIAAGRQSRLRHGSGLDVLQTNLKNGTEPDLIANSKKRMIKLW